MDSHPLPLERDDPLNKESVVVIRIEQPDRKVVVLDKALLQRLDATLDELEGHTGGVVIASDSRVFVAGADLQEILSLDDADLDEYLAFGQHVLGRIAALLGTTVAAVDGAALGGGLELAMHCDALLGLQPAPDAKPYKVGLPECGLGLCPGWGGTNLLPARIDAARAIAMTSTGATLDPAQALELGLFERLIDSPDELLTAAKRRAAEPKRTKPHNHEPRNISWPAISPAVEAALNDASDVSQDAEAARAVAQCVRTGMEQGWQAALEMERRSLVHLRSTDTAQRKLDAFFSRAASR